MTTRTSEAKARNAMLTPEQRRSLRVRNIALGAAVGLLMALFYIVTIVKLTAVVHPPA